MLPTHYPATGRVALSNEPPEDMERERRHDGSIHSRLLQPARSPLGRREMMMVCLHKKERDKENVPPIVRSGCWPAGTQVAMPMANRRSTHPPTHSAPLGRARCFGGPCHVLRDPGTVASIDLSQASCAAARTYAVGPNGVCVTGNTHTRASLLFDPLWARHDAMMPGQISSVRYAHPSIGS